MEVLFICSFIVLIMLVWFKSEAIVDWGCLFGLYWILKTSEYYQMKLDSIPAELNYPMFLRYKYNNFVTRMLACPLCLCIWLSTFFCFAAAILTTGPLFVFFIPTTVIVSLCIYGATAKLLK
jgi:hypothetical protein